MGTPRVALLLVADTVQHTMVVSFNTRVQGSFSDHNRLCFEAPTPPHGFSSALGNLYSAFAGGDYPNPYTSDITKLSCKALGYANPVDAQAFQYLYSSATPAAPGPKVTAWFKNVKARHMDDIDSAR